MLWATHVHMHACASLVSPAHSLSDLVQRGALDIQFKDEIKNLAKTEPALFKQMYTSIYSL